MTKYLQRINIDSKIMVGKPVIRGTRIPVDLILAKLAQNINVKEILGDYPSLTEDDVKAAIYYAKAILDHEEVYPFAN